MKQDVRLAAFAMRALFGLRALHEAMGSTHALARRHRATDHVHSGTAALITSHPQATMRANCTRVAQGHPPAYPHGKSRMHTVPQAS